MWTNYNKTLIGYNMLYAATRIAIQFINVACKLFWPYLSTALGLLGLALGLALGLVGCSSSQPVKALPQDADVFWSAEANAIVLKFTASKDLNMDLGQPSSLSICLYQLSDARVFEQLQSQGPEGLAALAACQSFGETVISFKRLFLEPGQKLEEFIDRREGAKFVGLAAGYYTLESKRCTRLVPVPITTISDGWFSSHREPGQLVMEFEFGSSWPQLPSKTKTP